VNNLLKKIEKSKKLQDEFIDHFETHVNFNKFDPSGLDYFLSEIGYDADEDLKADKPWCCPWEWNPEDLIHHKKDLVGNTIEELAKNWAEKNRNDIADKIATDRDYANELSREEGI